MSPERKDTAQRDDWPVPTPEVMRLLERGPAWGFAAAEEREPDDGDAR